jgi:hypothetical protein
MQYSFMELIGSRFVIWIRCLGAVGVNGNGLSELEIPLYMCYGAVSPEPAHSIIEVMRFRDARLSLATRKNREIDSIVE